VTPGHALQRPKQEIVEALARGLGIDLLLPDLRSLELWA
jgi:hypothetical protein